MGSRGRWKSVNYSVESTGRSDPLRETIWLLVRSRLRQSRRRRSGPPVRCRCARRAAPPRTLSRCRGPLQNIFGNTVILHGYVRPQVARINNRRRLKLIKNRLLTQPSLVEVLLLKSVTRLSPRLILRVYNFFSIAPRHCRLTRDNARLKFPLKIGGENKRCDFRAAEVKRASDGSKNGNYFKERELYVVPGECCFTIFDITSPPIEGMLANSDFSTFKGERESPRGSVPVDTHRSNIRILGGRLSRARPCVLSTAFFPRSPFTLVHN